MEKATETIKASTAEEETESAVHGTHAPGGQGRNIFTEQLPGLKENVIQTMLDLTARAAKFEAQSGEPAANQQETKSQEAVTSARYTSAMEKTQDFTQRMLQSHTQYFVHGNNNRNNRTHFFEEPEPSPGYSESHRRRMNNNFQIQQPILHGGGLSRSNPLQPQPQQLSLPVPHQHETSNAPLEGEVAHADPGYSRNHNEAKVRSKTKREKRRRRSESFEIANSTFGKGREKKKQETRLIGKGRTCPP